MSNTQQKKHARDYQRLHPGTSYTEALRQVRSRPVALWLQLESTGPTRPRPLAIDGRTAAVGHQDIWQGNPIRLIRFTETPEPGPFELVADNWLAYDPEACLGLYPVLADTDDRWSTFTAAVETVTVRDEPVSGLPDVDDLVASTVRPFTLEIREAHHDDNEFYLLGTFTFPTETTRDEAYADIPEHEHDCQNPRVKKCYLVDLCDEDGAIVDTKEITAATAKRLLTVTTLASLREHARKFNATVNDPAFWRDLLV